jgi:Transmembrane Fragile-X-F protein
MQKNTGLSQTGLLSTLLLVAFIVLKLCKVIDWNWWWVLSPLWIPICLAVVIGIVYFIIKSKVKEPEKERGIIITKSKWQERYEQMQESQKKIEALKNKAK